MWRTAQQAEPEGVEQALPPDLSDQQGYKLLLLRLREEEVTEQTVLHQASS